MNVVVIFICLESVFHCFFNLFQPFPFPKVSSAALFPSLNLNVLKSVTLIV